MLVAYGAPMPIPLKLKGSLGKTFHVVLLSCIGDEDPSCRLAGVLQNICSNPQQDSAATGHLDDIGLKQAMVLQRSLLFSTPIVGEVFPIAGFTKICFAWTTEIDRRFVTPASLPTNGLLWRSLSHSESTNLAVVPTACQYQPDQNTSCVVLRCLHCLYMRLKSACLLHTIALESSNIFPSAASMTNSFGVSSSLLDKIDRLFACNVGDCVDLPQIVVVGDQSSGKSSVLEGLTGLPFPRDSELCTRFATQITFRRSRDANITVSILPGGTRSSQDKERLRSWNKSEIKFLDPENFRTVMAEVCFLGLSWKRDSRWLGHARNGYRNE
jgi:hypothetical protein